MQHQFPINYIIQKSAFEGTLTHKIENGQRQSSIEVLHKLAKIYGMTSDQLKKLEDRIPNEGMIEDEP